MKPRWLIAIIGAGIVLIGALWFALQREEITVVGTPSAPERGTRTVELFFPAVSGEMTRETREIVAGGLLEEDVRRVVEELIAGGETGLHPLPPATRLRNAFYDGEGEVILNFTEHLHSDHPGGSEAENATLRSVVTTLGVNFPGVDRVRILVEGEAIRTLAGHTDLSRPLDVRDYR
ncbi:MAG TPA: GerMN domain-containing protein [bacterium]|nr:GerMN domain-containing protein [bacterium]